MTRESEDEIKLPARVTYDGLAGIEFSAKKRVIDWSDVAFVDLSEILTLLAFRPPAQERPMEWRYSPTAIAGSIEDDPERLKFLAQMENPDAVERVRTAIAETEQWSKQGKLYPANWSKQKEAMRFWAGTGAVRSWLEYELRRRGDPALLGFLARTSATARARELGIHVDQRFDECWRVRYGANDAHFLEITSIQNATEMSDLVGGLSSQQRLTEAFGRYASLDPFESGAFAEILIPELANNARQHSNATAAWLAARIVTKGPSLDCQGPWAHRLVHSGVEYLEVVVCDDGWGLHGSLSNQLGNDHRRRVIDKFGEAHARPTPTDLALYAVDRLTTSKPQFGIPFMRDETADQGVGAPSGLYWLWRLAQGRSGILSIRSLGTETWFDFDDSGAHTYQSVSTPPMGTLIRVLLPTVSGRASRAKTSAPQSTRDHTLAEKRTNLPAYQATRGDDTRRGTTQYVWLADLTAGIARGRDGRPVTAEECANALAARLVERQEQLVDGDLLILDVCGIRERWRTTIAHTLCAMAMDFNYSSTLGTSTVVIANIPDHSWDTFGIAGTDAHERFKQLQHLRPITLFLSEGGKARFFVTEGRMMRVLDQLHNERSIDAHTLAHASGLSEDDILAFARRNTHLLQVTHRNVSLNAWYKELAPFCFMETLRWFEGIVDKTVDKGGIRLQGAGCYYRLPSTGLLTTDFYHVRRLFADSEWTGRVAWMIATMMAAWEMSNGKTIELIVWVTRGAMELVGAVATHFQSVTGRTVDILGGSTFDELERNVDRVPCHDRPAIFVTTAVGTGDTAQRVFDTVPARFIAVAACLDTREPYDGGLRVRLFGQALVNSRQAIRDVTTLALLPRPVRKYQPDQVPSDSEVIAIDEIDTAPVSGKSGENIGTFSFWDHIGERSSAIRLGHFGEGAYHHYIYYADFAAITRLPRLAPNSTLIDELNEQVVRDLGSTDPDRVVILHPPRDQSSGEILARAIETRTGARYRLTVFRDRHAGQWRFSSYVQHHIGFEKAIAVIVDDGSNTGETLMGLLNATLELRPSLIRVYVGISRMPVHKALLLKSIRSLTWCPDVSVHMLFHLDIPVYPPQQCPLCGLLVGLEKASIACPLLRGWLAAVVDKLRPRLVGEPTELFYLPVGHSESAARLREAIERHVYDRRSLQRLNELLGREPTVSEILDLSFIAATEPEVVGASIFVPALARLTAQAATALPLGPLEAVRTLFLGSFSMACEVRKHRSASQVKELCFAIASNMLEAVRGDVELIAETCGLIVAHTMRGSAGDASVRREVGRSLFDELSLALGKHGRGELFDTFAEMFVHAARNALEEGALLRGPGIAEHSDSWIPDEAFAVAASVMGHSREVVRSDIEELRALGDRGPGAAQVRAIVNEIARRVGMVVAFGRHLRQIDRELALAPGLESGSLLYWTGEVDEAIANFAESLASVARSHFDAGSQAARSACDVLATRWERLCDLLSPLLGNIFPEVMEIIDRELSRIADSGHVGVQVAGANPRIISSERGFLPAALLRRFIEVATDNWQTVAFLGADPDEASKRAVGIGVYLTEADDGSEMIRVTVSDNGPNVRPRGVSVASPGGTHTGLASLRLLCKPYGAVLSQVTENDDWTQVSLELRRKPSVQGGQYDGK